MMVAVAGLGDISIERYCKNHIGSITCNESYLDCQLLSPNKNTTACQLREDQCSYKFLDTDYRRVFQALSIL